MELAPADVGDVSTIPVRFNQANGGILTADGAPVVLSKPNIARWPPSHLAERQELNV
jgi:hypothetical protein